MIKNWNVFLSELSKSIFDLPENVENIHTKIQRFLFLGFIYRTKVKKNIDIYYFDIAI